VDLLDSAELPVPEGAPWDVAFHLAGHTQPALDWTRARVLENLHMTARVFDHLRDLAPGCRVILASSAHVYSPSNDKLTEASPIGPRHPYGVSKRLCEVWALARTLVLEVQIVRAFTQLGPGLPQGLMVPDLMDKIRAGQNPIRMRGRDDRRDYLDIRDAVVAYEALMTVEAPSGSFWNLCSGRECRVSELVQSILNHLGLEIPIYFEQPGVECFLGDRSRLTGATGWVPRYGLEEIAANLADGARGKA
jgi:nucleoside-diphosphate-sugar epimerase